jgi:hypothetical protein
MEAAGHGGRQKEGGPPMNPGDYVRWTADGEEGRIQAVTPDAIAVCWLGSNTIEWYALCSGAIDRIELTIAN